ncbi:MAG: translation initiation factor IF-3 [Phycisphaerales bacterium]
MQGPVQRTRINHMIRLSPVRLIDHEGEQVGVIDTHEALRMAQEVGLDLVEISPDARPPVCKIMDYGKYKYELSKKEQKGKSSGQELKEIRLGRSIKIDPHDVGIRVNQARRFLMAGHKVQITQRFRGREMAHKELGEERLIGVCQDLADVAKIEMAPRGVGRAITLVLAPDKVKIDAIKAQLIKDGKQAEEDLEKLEAEVAAQNAADDAAHGDDDQDENSSKKKGKSRGPKDNRAGNPVDDEVADMLGEL